MPFALSTLGALFILLGFQNTYKDFFKLFMSEFTGEGNFIYWIASIGVVGSLGYIESLKGFSRLFMALIIVSMIIANQRAGLFEQLMNALREGTAESVDYFGAPLSGGAGGGESSNGDTVKNIINTGIKLALF